MKKIVYALLATVSGLVLLFSYRTSHVDDAPLAQDASTPSSTTGTSGTSGTSGTTGTSGTGDAAGAASGSGLADGAYTGAAENTRYGPVQVQITVSGGQITDVQVPEYPSSNPRDRQINGRAVPVLVSETTAAQSADIDMVSGATYTSEGYLQSLQSAIDQAQS